MVYTVTLNPAVDYYLTMEELSLGGLNEIRDGYTLAGGKGINVSKVLKSCGVHSTATGFLGGFTGEYIKKDMRDYGIDDMFVNIVKETRINIKLNTTNCETEIAGQSPTISDVEYKKFCNILSDIISGDILVLSGSIPSTMAKDIYKIIVDKMSKGVKIIFDSRGAGFKKALGPNIYLTKPNVKELEELFDEKFETTKEIIEAGKRLQKMGSQNVLISRGKDGSILITENDVFIGNVPKGKLVSSVGAGDSMIAGFIYGISKGDDILTSYKLAIAAGSATAYKYGLADVEDINRLLDDIQITKEEL